MGRQKNRITRWRQGMMRGNYKKEEDTKWVSSSFLCIENHGQASGHDWMIWSLTNQGRMCIMQNVDLSTR